eukprot:5374848-Pyramimonas_sp.AAC.1
MDDITAAWTPLRGSGLGVQGGNGGGEDGGGACLKCHGPHRLLDCLQGVALLQDGSESFAWQYDAKHPRRKGGGTLPVRAGGRPQARPHPRQGGGPRQQRHVPALMPPPA